MWVARSTQEIKSSISMAKAANNKKVFIKQKIGLTYKKEIRKVLHLGHEFMWC